MRSGKPAADDEDFGVVELESRRCRCVFRARRAAAACRAASSRAACRRAERPRKHDRAEGDGTPAQKRAPRYAGSFRAGSASLAIHDAPSPPMSRARGCAPSTPFFVAARRRAKDGPVHSFSFMRQYRRLSSKRVQGHALIEHERVVKRATEEQDRSSALAGSGKSCALPYALPLDRARCFLTRFALLRGACPAI